MGFFDRLIGRAKATANDIMDKTEDVASTARQSVRDIEDDIARVEEAHVGVRAQRNLLETAVSTAQGEVDKFAGYAAKAVARGDEKLARAALTDKAAAMTKLAEAKKILAEYEPSVQAVEDQLQALRVRRDQMSRSTDMIEARSAVADAKSHAATVLGGIGSAESASKTFDRLNTSLERREAEADARMSMANEKNAKPADKYATLDAVPETDIEAELAALKAAAGK